MPSEIAEQIAASSVGRALATLSAWSAFGEHLRDLRRRVGISPQAVERRSGLPLSRLVEIESGMHAAAETPDDCTPPTDAEIRAYCSALDFEAEPFVRRAAEIRGAG